MKSITYALSFTALLTGSSLALATTQTNNSLNQQKINTIKSMYAQHEEAGKVADGATTGLDLLYLYGGLELKDSIMGYMHRHENISQDDTDSYIDCAETYPSIYSGEQPRDDFRRLWLDDAYVTENGKVRAIINGFTFDDDIVSYNHDFTLMCHGSDCQVTDVDMYDGYPLKNLLDNACYQ